MNRLLARWFSIPWYPVVLGAYPILALLGGNIQQVETQVVFRPLFISLAVSIFLMLLLRLIIRDWHHAAFSAAMLILLFFTYGHIYNYIKTISIFGLVLGRHRFLLMIWAILGAFAILGAMWKRVNLVNQTTSINTISLALLIFPIYAITIHWVSVRNAPSSYSQPVQNLGVAKNQSLPDIYYIILDSYTRSDVLKNVYNYDNSAFLNDLKDMGFYIADCSTSNYMWTRLSISSALNMQYLQDNPAYIAAGDKDVVTEDLIKHSLVRKTLGSLGYKTIAFATGFPFNEITDAELYLEPPTLTGSIREFDALLVQTTLLRVLQDFDLIRVNQGAGARFRDRTLFALDKFDDLARMGGPKFVYIHIITPHPPFVFGPDGEAVDPKDFISTEGQYTADTYFQGYTDQVDFISDQMIISIRKLLVESKIPPVIIIQGDHGPWKQEGENRVSILNAYYLPQYEENLFPSISPVNSFRIVLTEFFNASYPLLDDLSYSSPYANVYDLKLQPTSCKNER